MSIRYKACVGYGIVIPQDNKNLISRISLENEYEDFSMPINGWSDNSDWFIGKIIATKDENDYPEYTKLSDNLDIITDMQVKEILANFDIHEQPSLYLLLRIT